MKKKIAALIVGVSITGMLFAGCGKVGDLLNADSESLQEEVLSAGEDMTTQTDSEALEENSKLQEDSTVQENSTSQEALSETETEEEYVRVSELSEGELEARRKQQANFDEARKTLYKLPNSKEKTIEINQMDRQILANNAYDFGDKNIVFIGDSITEGIAGSVDSEGNYISFVTYVESYLHFNKYLNHGMGGRMFGDYGGEDLSLALNFGNVTNVDSDIIVVMAGVNDYLSVSEGKRFGDINNTMSNAGYCGAVRYFMDQLDEYYGDKDIFFVMMYNIASNVEAVYSDITTQPTLNDYLDVQRKLAGEHGFNVIDLYNTGFMDCTDLESEDYFLNDVVHPNDMGNIVLGEHIAAELSLYYSQQ